MEKSPLVSVIVPVYKVEKYLKNCIESVINQSYPRWELILVDDGSPDMCPLICDEYASKNHQVVVIHKSNGGLSSARNAGLDVCHGDFITFLDSDDFLHQDFLNKLVQCQCRYDADIVQCDFIRSSTKSFPKNNLNISINILNNHTIFTNFRASTIVWGKLYRAFLFNNLRMPVGKINEDEFVTWKLYYNAKTIVVIGDILYHYTINENSIMSSQIKNPHLDFLEAFDERISFFVNKGEDDLEIISRIQYCKPLLLMYSNPYLTEEQKNFFYTQFIKQWSLIKNTNSLNKHFKLLYYSFYKFPSFTSKIVNLLH